MTINQQCIPLDSPKEWREALNGIKHTFGHTWENCYAMHLTTGLKTYLYSFEKDNIRIVCPIAEREYGGYIDIVKPFGFSGFVGNGDCSEFPHYWLEFVKERGYVCGYFGLNPIFDDRTHFKSEEIYPLDTIYVLDLTPGIDELLAKMSMGRRQQLRHWDDISSNLVLEKPTLEDFFFNNYFDFLGRKNASPVYFFSEETLSFLFSLDNVLLVGAQTSGKVVAVNVFAVNSDVGEGLFNISLPEGRKHSAALIWYAVNYLKSLRIPAFNLGGGSSGIGQFKQRFGCKGLPRKGLKQIYEPEIYNTLCRQVNADPKDMTGYFPAYRKGDFGFQTRTVKSAREVHRDET
jgi:hypothetical protein